MNQIIQNLTVSGNLTGVVLLIIILAALLITLILSGVCKIINRIIRHFNIRARGWPPKHLDADGDQIEDEDGEA